PACCRPQVLALEDRLLPGETVLGLALAAVWLEPGVEAALEPLPGAITGPSLKHAALTPPAAAAPAAVPPLGKVLPPPAALLAAPPPSPRLPPPAVSAGVPAPPSPPSQRVPRPATGPRHAGYPVPWTALSRPAAPAGAPLVAAAHQRKAAAL